ncbi:MAG: hypothetical protein LUF27_13755 [Lachnospiraceae bacterium]|nr:hypothetical protein [Lachnospiraceae bacterium]
MALKITKKTSTHNTTASAGRLIKYTISAAFLFPAEDELLKPSITYKRKRCRPLTRSQNRAGGD